MKETTQTILNPNEIHVYADGSCKGCPGPMASGVFIRYWDEGVIKCFREGMFLGEGTNNQAELYAISRGLTILRKIPGWRDSAVKIITDSKYAIGVLTLGYTVNANHELIATITKMLAITPGVLFQHVRGHKGNYGNEMVDKLALRSRTLESTFTLVDEEQTMVDIP